MKVCVFILTCLLALPVPARIITVDDDGPPADFNNIQDAIDDSNAGDEVHVRPGTYYEKVIMKDGVDLIGAGADVTIIDAEEMYSGSLVSAENIQDPNTTLSGFTLRNAGFSNGGISVHDSYLIIERNIIRDNGRCVPGFPGDICGGGGIYTNHSVVIIRHNILCNNLLSGIYTRGGFNQSLPPSTILNNIVVNNGGGISGSTYSSLIIRNNTINNNDGAGISSNVGSSLLIVNNIVTSNRVGVVKDNTSSSATLLYNDVWNNTEDNYRYISPGPGDISEDPLFVAIGEDHHLKSEAGRYDTNTSAWIADANTSPCIDTGDPMTPIGAELFPNGGIINMGAYGGTAEASKSYFGKPPCEVIVAGDINGDCEVNFLDFRLMALHWLEGH